MKYVVGRLMSLSWPQMSTSRICDYVVLRGKMDTADGIKVAGLNIGVVLDFLRGLNLITWALKTEEGSKTSVRDEVSV